MALIRGKQEVSRWKKTRAQTFTASKIYFVCIIASSRSIHVGATTLTEQHSVLCINHTFFVQSSAGGQSDGFHVFHTEDSVDITVELEMPLFNVLILISSCAFLIVG